jgi:hypothetical protein
MKYLEINTPKIKSEMKRLKLTYDAIGQLHNPTLTRQAVWIMVQKARSLNNISWLADVLGVEPKDLITERYKPK